MREILQQILKTGHSLTEGRTGPQLLRTAKGGQVSNAFALTSETGGANRVPSDPCMASFLGLLPPSTYRARPCPVQTHLETRLAYWPVHCRQRAGTLEVQCTQVSRDRQISRTRNHRPKVTSSPLSLLPLTLSLRCFTICDAGSRPFFLAAKTVALAAKKIRVLRTDGRPDAMTLLRRDHVHVVSNLALDRT